MNDWCSLTFLSPRKFGLVIPAPVTELRGLRRLKLLRIASKQFAPLLLPPGFANLAPTLSELVLESADWPAIPQVLTSSLSIALNSVLLNFAPSLLLPAIVYQTGAHRPVADARER